MKSIIKNKKILLIVSIITIVLIVGLVGTYAWYVWNSNEEQRTRIVTSVGAATVIYEDGASLLGQNIRPVEDKTKGIVKKINVRTNVNTAYKVSFNLYLDVNTLDEGLKHESFKYELWSGETLVKSGDFTQSYLDDNLVACSKNNTSHIVLLSDVTITKTLSEYVLYIWIDGVNYTNPDTMINQEFSFKLHADGQGAVIAEAGTPNTNNITNGTLAYNIVNLYNNAEKEKIVNGGVRYYIDTTNKLISDVEGNVRYYGKTPNNYVYFNCNDYSNQNSSTCEKWRIIGVFDGKLKIVRDEVLGSYAWDYNSDGKYDNNWHDSTLMELLNNGYYNNSDNISYYNNSLTPITINFASDNKGLKNDYTRNLISENIWYLGGNTNSTIYSNEMYMNERSNLNDGNNKNYWEGKIALMYPSDYGYASDLSVCNETLEKYSSSSNCYGTDWIFNKNYQWLLSSDTRNNTTSVAWIIRTTGFVNTSYVYNAVGVRPTLYLDENVISYFGDGSSDYPYSLIKKDDFTPLEYGDAVTAINNYYMNNDKRVVANNKIEYNYAPLTGMMNDRLDGTTSDYDAGNIRYYGTDPNNYVDIGDRTSDNEVILYRIIGLFKDVELADGTKKDLIKVIRDESIGDYPWDNKPSGVGSSTSNGGSSNWTDARLMMLLNPGYENGATDVNGNTIYEYEGSLWWNSKSGECYNEVGFCDFTSSGLSSNVHNKIENVVWNIEIYPDNQTEWIGKVSLMYSSDWSYADVIRDSKKYYNKNSWIANKYIQWLLDPIDVDRVNRACPINYGGGGIHWACIYMWVHYPIAVRPVFYLNSELSIESGEGTKDSPYVLG